MSIKPIQQTNSDALVALEEIPPTGWFRPTDLPFERPWTVCESLVEAAYLESELRCDGGITARRYRRKNSAEPLMRGLGAARAYLWMRRLVWLFGVVLVLFSAMLYFDLPHQWIAPVFSFVCAEITRRIAAESNPDVSVRWRDIIKLLLNPTRELYKTRPQHH